MTGALLLLVAAAAGQPLAPEARTNDLARELRELEEAARVPWPLVPDEVETRIAERLASLDRASRQAWAADRALPALAGELPVAAAALPKILEEIRSVAAPAALAALERARVHYARRELAEASARYAEVGRGSALWPQALKERAWTLLLLDRPMEALGATVSLGAPYFPSEDHAEARLLKATVLLERCRYAEARALVAPVAEPPVVEPTEGEAVAWMRAGSPPEPGTSWAVAWDSPLVRRIRLALPRAAGQRDAVERRGARLLLVAAREEAAARRELKARALAVRYEALKAERRLLEAGGTPRRPGSVLPPPLDDDEVAWGFDGTFWRDELGSYRTVPADGCPTERAR
jgi:hypothetical protein